MLQRETVLTALTAFKVIFYHWARSGVKEKETTDLTLAVLKLDNLLVIEWVVLAAWAPPAPDNN
jgi:hypothetical protein